MRRRYGPPEEIARDLVRFQKFRRDSEALAALAVTDKVSGLCRGFGFVEMAELADVALAFSLLNNTLLKGQQIEIEADPALKNGKARNRAVQSLGAPESEPGPDDD